MIKNCFIAGIFALLHSGITLGQVQNEVAKSLATKDFVAFKQLTDSLSNPQERIKGYWEFLRDLTSEFQEGIFLFQKTVPDRDNPNVSSVFSFKVKIITSNTRIAFYELSEEKHLKLDGENHWVTVDSPIDRFKDEQLFDSLKNAFKVRFHADLNEKDLFSEHFAYGERCGFAGTFPDGRYEVTQFVKSGNKEALVQWLQSANTEKQVYAVDGLYQLHAKGVKLTKEELQMIAFVMNKKGSIYACHGCMYGRDTIKEAVSASHF